MELWAAALRLRWRKPCIRQLLADAGLQNVEGQGDLRPPRLAILPLDEACWSCLLPRWRSATHRLTAAAAPELADSSQAAGTEEEQLVHREVRDAIRERIEHELRQGDDNDFPSAGCSDC